MTAYQELLNKHGYIDEYKVGVNQEGEAVLVTIDDKAAYVRTIQKNGWNRINIYYKDSTEEELYER